MAADRSGSSKQARLYLIAFTWVAMALLARSVLEPFLSAQRPYLTLFGGVALAVWYSRWKPAALASVVGFFAANYLFVPPLGTFVFDRFFLAEMIGFVLSAGFIIFFGEAMHRARDKAWERREKLRMTLASIGDAVITTDAEARVTYLNAVAESLLGWTNDEAYCKPLETVFNIINETTRDRVASPADRALREGAVVGLANHTVLIRRDGSELPIDDSAAPIRDVQGRIIGCVLVFRDITERRRSERELREADRRKTEFLATLAHELRNPLAPLSNSLQVIRLAGHDKNAVETSMEVMERQIRHMSRLVDDLLDVARISRGKIELRPERVEVVSVLNEAIESSRPMLESHSQTVVTDLTEEPIYINADPVRLTQIFGNVINNACKYSPPNRTIRVSARSDGEDVTVSIKDQGIGIPPDKLSTIFDMFSQINANPLDSTGLGIGLTLVRRLVEMHGGHVEAQSPGEGAGCEFRIRLPIDRGSPSVEEPAPDPKPNVVTRRILIVDDNVDNVDSMAAVLGFAGHEIRTANDGEQALDAADGFRPEVVILDIGLPGLSGFEVCQALRKNEWAAETTFIALTGWGQRDDRQRSKEAGFHHHVVKPVNIDMLLSLLDPDRGETSDNAPGPLAGIS